MQRHEGPNYRVVARVSTRNSCTVGFEAGRAAFLLISAQGGLTTRVFNSIYKGHQSAKRGQDVSVLSIAN